VYAEAPLRARAHGVYDGAPSCFCVCADGDKGVESRGVKGTMVPRLMLCNMSLAEGEVK
jgi:hypothetical protein